MPLSSKPASLFLIIFVTMSKASYIDIQFKGKGFSPRLFAEKMELPVTALVESGELGKVGRYKGKPVPYGIGLLKIEPNSTAVHQYAEILSRKKNLLNSCSVEEIVFDVDATSKAMENISIDSETLKQLTAINARIQFHASKSQTNEVADLISRLSSLLLSSNVPQKELLDKLVTENSKKNKNAFGALYGLFVTLTNRQKSSEASELTFDKAVKDYSRG